METAGKFVEDEELRAALKENGIGRPSSRAGIIETLFKRHYIRRQRKNLMATPTGIELIDTIHEELLKSCELTGIWEKKLRDIEHKTYDPADFINGLKEQINKIVIDVSVRQQQPESDHHDRGRPQEETGKENGCQESSNQESCQPRKRMKLQTQNAGSQNAPAQPVLQPGSSRPNGRQTMSALRQGRHHQGQDRLWLQQLEGRLPISPAILADVNQYETNKILSNHNSNQLPLSDKLRH